MNINSINTILYNTQYLKKQFSLHTERLSTGLKINHASDDPSLMYRINRLNAEIRGKDASSKNMQDGISLIQTTESSLTTMKNMGERLKELSVRYNSDTLNLDDKKVIENESKELLKEMNYVKDNTKFNGQNVFSKTDYNIQTGGEAGNKYTIKIPDLNGLNNDKTVTKTASNLVTVKANIDTNNTNINSLIGESKCISYNPIDGVNSIIGSIFGCVSSGTTNTTTSGTGTTSTGTTNTSGSTTSNSSTGTGIGTTTSTTGVATNNTNSSSNIPRFTLPSPTIHIPDQYGSSGYKKILDENGKLLYNGNLTNGKIDGYGTYYGTKDDRVYNGDWSNNTYNGFGSLYNTNSTLKYQGDIKNGTPEGWGTYYTDSGTIQYQGNLKDGYREGWGTSFDSNGNVIESKNFNDYTAISASSTGTGSGTNTGTGTGTTTNPSSGTGTNTGTTTNPSTGTGGTGSTGTTTGGTGTGTTSPSGNTSDPSGDDSISNILKGDYIDKYILKPISEGISNLGIQEEILNYRYEWNESQNSINEDTLSRIQDADMAKEILAKSKADMLLQVNASLFSSQLDFDKNYISTLLR